MLSKYIQMCHSLTLSQYIYTVYIYIYIYIYYISHSLSIYGGVLKLLLVPNRAPISPRTETCSSYEPPTSQGRATDEPPLRPTFKQGTDRLRAADKPRTSHRRADNDPPTSRHGYASSMSNTCKNARSVNATFKHTMFFFNESGPGREF